MCSDDIYSRDTLIEAMGWARKHPSQTCTNGSRTTVSFDEWCRSDERKNLLVRWHQHAVSEDAQSWQSIWLANIYLEEWLDVDLHTISLNSAHDHQHEVNQWNLRRDASAAKNFPSANRDLFSVTPIPKRILTLNGWKPVVPCNL